MEKRSALLILSLLLAGCRPAAAPQTMELPPLDVPVALPIEREIVDFDASDLFGPAAARQLGRDLISDPSLLSRRADLWLPVASAYDVAAKDQGSTKAEQVIATRPM